MNTFPFIFPRTIFVDQNGICGQVAHIATEAAEAAAETRNPDVFALAVEIMDGLHSSETGLRILQEKYGVDLNAVHDAVIRKNQPRGYYGNQIIYSLCDSCAKADVSCPVYPMFTTRCVEYRVKNELP